MEQKQFVEEMAEKIKECGSKAVWLAIEAIGEVDKRVRFRKVFFEAGGSLEENK